jgi:hypothetical protein
MASSKLLDLYGFEIQPTVQQQAERLECDATCEVRPLPPPPPPPAAPSHARTPGGRTQPHPAAPSQPAPSLRRRCPQRETYTWKPYIEKTRLPAEGKAKDLVRKGVPPTLRTWVRAPAVTARAAAPLHGGCCTAAALQRLAAGPHLLPPGWPHCAPPGHGRAEA